MKTDDKKSEVPRNMLTLWMKFGDELKLTQRLGYALMSLFLLLFGLTFTATFVPEVKDGYLFGLFWIAMGLVPLALGIAGLVNVLRFPKS